MENCFKLDEDDVSAQVPDRSRAHEVYVVMAGLMVLAPHCKSKNDPRIPCGEERDTPDGDDHSGPGDDEQEHTCDEKDVQIQDDPHLLLFVRDEEHDLRGHVYGVGREARGGAGGSYPRFPRGPTGPSDYDLTLKNHRLCFGWDRERGACPDRYRWSMAEPNRGFPNTPHEAKSMLWVPTVGDVLGHGSVQPDVECVDTVPIRRIVGAQVVLDKGELSVGHLTKFGGLVPQFRIGPPENEDEKASVLADVLVLRLLPPKRARYLVIASRLLPCLDPCMETVDRIRLNPEAPVIVSLTNLARTVNRISPVAGHMRHFRELCALPRPRVVEVPRIKSGLQYTMVQPGWDFDGIEDITPPSVHNRPLCPPAQF